LSAAKRGLQILRSTFAGGTNPRFVTMKWRGGKLVGRIDLLVGTVAYLGTVHAVCLRLLKEFAIDAGLSPEVDVIPGNEGRRLLQAALERELDPGLRSRLQELAFELRVGRPRESQ
jgi:superfamily I DNA/RNA helicase